VNLHEFIESKDNRVAVDALIDLIKVEGLKDEYCEKLLGWFSAKDKSFQLSALYAAYMIHRYWLAYRPEYLVLNLNFKKIETALNSFDRKDPNFQKWIRLYDDLRLRKSA